MPCGTRDHVVSVGDMIQGSRIETLRYDPGNYHFCPNPFLLGIERSLFVSLSLPFLRELLQSFQASVSSPTVRFSHRHSCCRELDWI